jgi:TonB family protein
MRFNQRMHPPYVAVMLWLVLAGCVRRGVQGAPSPVIPCQFSPAETWRGQPCIGDCTHGPTPETPPLARDSAAVIAGVVRIRASARRESGWSKRIHLRALIQEDGSVQEVTLRQSSGDARVDAAALGLVRRLRFVPRKVGRRFVPSHVDLVMSPAAVTDPPLTCTLQSNKRDAGDDPVL